MHVVFRFPSAPDERYSYLKAETPYEHISVGSVADYIVVTRDSLHVYTVAVMESLSHSLLRVADLLVVKQSTSTARGCRTRIIRPTEVAHKIEGKCHIGKCHIADPDIERIHSNTKSELGVSCSHHPQLHSGTVCKEHFFCQAFGQYTIMNVPKNIHPLVIVYPPHSPISRTHENTCCVGYMFLVPSCRVQRRCDFIPHPPPYCDGFSRWSGC